MKQKMLEKKHNRGTGTPDKNYTDEIDKIRGQKNLSMKTVAEQIGLSRTQLHRHVNDKQVLGFLSCSKVERWLEANRINKDETLND
jgi:AraC-like DNA-binding protein